MVFQVADPPEHGGDLLQGRRLFPDAPKPFIDLSTGINPYSYPLPPLAPELFARLPQPDALDQLAAVATEAYGAPSPACIVAAPGTQSLLPLVGALGRIGNAAILSPTYAEHARAAALAGHHVIETPDLDRLRAADLAIVVNPNNPDGRIFTRADLVALADELGQFEQAWDGDAPLSGKAKQVSLFSPSPERGGSDHPRWSGEGSQAAPDPLLDPSPFRGRRETRNAGLLVVDEAFMDVGPPQASLAGEVMRGNVVVLRSFGKFFGLAGLRLGFAIAAPAMAARLAASLGPWAVSGPALAIGAAALGDHAWIASTRERLAAGAQRLDALLTVAGLQVVGGTALFRLAQSPAARRLFEALGRAGILVRHFADHPEWLRFGLPGGEDEWDRLARALAAAATTHTSPAR
jgi:cobalamin biosynthetic protein CobC